MKNSRDHNIRPADTSRPARRSFGRWFAFAVLVAAGLALFWLADLRAATTWALHWIEGLGVWAAVWFVLIYVAATVFFLPGSVLTLGAGALFGVVRGSIYVSLGSTLGAAAAFLVGRHFARAWVARKIDGNASFAAIDRAVAHEGWKIVGLTRLSPAFPFSLLNYAFGLTQVRFRDYVVASWIGMMPGTVMYVYIGSLAQAGAGNRQRTPVEWAFYGVGLIATVAVTVLVTRLARAALAKRARTP